MELGNIRVTTTLRELNENCALAYDIIKAIEDNRLQGARQIATTILKKTMT